MYMCFSWLLLMILSRHINSNKKGGTSSSITHLKNCFVGKEMNVQHQVIQHSLRKNYLCSSGLHTHTQFVKPVSVALKQSRAVYNKDVAFHIINSIAPVTNNLGETATPNENRSRK